MKTRMHNGSRLLSLLLAVVLVFTLTVPALAAEKPQDMNLRIAVMSDLHYLSPDMIAHQVPTPTNSITFCPFCTSFLFAAKAMIWQPSPLCPEPANTQPQARGARCCFCSYILVSARLKTAR